MKYKLEAIEIAAVYLVLMATLILCPAPDLWKVTGIEAIVFSIMFLATQQK